MFILKRLTIFSLVIDELYGARETCNNNLAGVNFLSARALLKWWTEIPTIIYEIYVCLRSENERRI